MTVAAQTPTISYVEDGTTTAFPVPFRYDSPADLRATRLLADGSTAELANGTAFTATPGPTNAGGTLTLTAPGPSGARLTIFRRTARTQTADYIANGAFTAESHEQALDKSMLVNQEQDVALGQALKVPAGETAPPFPSVSQRAGRTLGFDLSGAPVPGPAMVPASAAQPERLVLTLEQFAPGNASYYSNPGDRGTDWYPVLMEALDAINRYAPVNARWPRVPRIELGLGAYFFGQKVEQKVAAHLRGQGGGHDDFNGGTRFLFPPATQGWTVNDSNTINGTTERPTTSAIGTVLEGIQFESEGGGTGWDTTAETSTQLGTAAAANTFGLWVRSTCTIRDCVTKGWKGNGAQIVAFAGAAGGLRGNANGTIIDRLTVREDGAGTPSYGHGVFVYGSNANACDFRSVQVRHSGLIGIWDLNTLGNTWTNPRVDDFGRVARATSDAELGCFYLGYNYILLDWRPGLGASTTPGTQPLVWFPIEAAAGPSALFPAWSAAANYVCMLPILGTGQSNTGTVKNPYIEGGFPGHAGGNPADPGCGITVYGGQSQWTPFTARIESVPSFGRGVASRSGFTGWRRSLRGSSEETNFGGYTEARLVDVAGELMRWRIEKGGEVNYFHRFNSSGDLVFERDGQPPLWYITTHLTARQNGRGVADPYTITFPNFVLSDPGDSGNNRRMQMGVGPPTSGGPYARGHRIWNVNPAVGQPEYWVCIDPGPSILGTWRAGPVLA